MFLPLIALEKFDPIDLCYMNAISFCEFEQLSFRFNNIHDHKYADSLMSFHNLCVE